MKFRIAAIGMMLAAPACAQSPGTVNLIGPSSTPGAPKITEVGTVNAIINQALSSKFDYGPIAGVPVGGSFVTPTGGTQQTLNNALGGSALKANNLSDLTDASTSRTNLGLGSIATQSAGAVSITGGAISTADTSGANVTPTGSTVRTLANGLAGPFTLTGSGTSGQYDAQISATGGGSVAGQGQLQMKSAVSQRLAADGSVQATVVSTPGAAEYWQEQGGIATAGATVYATNGTLAGNVDGNLVAQNEGAVRIGNGSGILAEFVDPGGFSGAHFQFIPAVSTSTLGAQAAVLQSTGDIVLNPAGAFHSIMMQIPDGTIAGGNTRGPNSIDLQYVRTNANQVASGFQSMIFGGEQNRAACGLGYCVVLGGFNNISTGAFSGSYGGQNGTDDGRFGVHFFSTGILSQVGDAEAVDAVLRGTSTAGAAVRLTADGLTAGATNVYNLPQSKMGALSLILACKNITTAAHKAAWFNTALLDRDATLASATLTTGTATTLGTDTMTVSATADTTLGGLNFTVTPPNTDTWHCALVINAAEAR